jgi:hypothetical protein
LKLPAKQCVQAIDHNSSPLNDRPVGFSNLWIGGSNRVDARLPGASAVVGSAPHGFRDFGLMMAVILKRPRRFVVQLPIRYKKIGGRSWFEGKTENMSRSGVLFRADRVLRPRTAIQMSFTLPVSLKGDGPGQVLCRGNVVRTVTAAGTNRPCVAVSIQRYRLVRRHKRNCPTKGRGEG